MVDGESQKPHVAVLASPGMGHVTPLLELAKRLVVDHGFHVTFLVILTDAPPVQIQLLNNNPTLPPDLKVIDLPRVDVAKLKGNVSIRIVQIVRESLRSLPSVLTNLHSLKALIVDPFCITALEIAAEQSIATYVFLTSSASFLALAMYFPMLNAEVEGDYFKIGNQVCVPGCKPLWLEDLIPGVLMPEVLGLCNRLLLVKGIIVNTWEELEPVSLRAIRENAFFLHVPAPPVYPIGPLTKCDEPVTSLMESNLLKWLDEQPPDSVVYVSFGSGGSLSAEQMSELALGLERSEKRFVWVARPPSEANAFENFFKAGCDVDDPGLFLPDGFLERTRGVGMVTVSWAPQVRVLSHPSVGGFVTHCGWNSVLESIGQGVAMIAWPLYAEQRMNARMLVDMGVGVRAEVDEGRRVVGRCEVERVVRMVMETEQGETMRRRVRVLQATATKPNGSLLHLAKEWRALATL